MSYPKRIQILVLIGNGSDPVAREIKRKIEHLARHHRPPLSLSDFMVRAALGKLNNSLPPPPAPKPTQADKSFYRHFPAVAIPANAPIKKTPPPPRGPLLDSDGFPVEKPVEQNANFPPGKPT